jgi:hypothetical protein
MPDSQVYFFEPPLQFCDAGSFENRAAANALAAEYSEGVSRYLPRMGISALVFPALRTEHPVESTQLSLPCRDRLILNPRMGTKV